MTDMQTPHDDRGATRSTSQESATSSKRLAKEEHLDVCIATNVQACSDGMGTTHHCQFHCHETAFAGVVDMLVGSNSSGTDPSKLDEVKACEYTYSNGKPLLLLLPPATPESICPTQSEPFVFEGEHFWDTAAVDDYVHDEATASEIEYWGLAYEGNAVYYFEFSTGRAEWLPPPSIVYDDEVLLWDPTDQWFYLYDPKVNTSRWWVDQFPTASSFIASTGTPPDDSLSQATTEDLDLQFEAATIDVSSRSAVSSQATATTIPFPAVVPSNLD